MPHGRGPSTGSSAGAGKGAGTKNKNKNGGSTGGKGVLSRVLGSFRRYSHNGDAPANTNKEEDTSWAETYKITHHPDRPRRDKREGLKSRNSADVLGQLHKIWRHNKEMLEEKRRQRRDRERGTAAAAAVEVVRSRSPDQMRRDNAGDQQSDDRGRNTTDREVKLPSPQPDVMPPFNWKPVPAPLPDFTQYEWRAPRSTYPPSSPSASSGRMTIRVGLEVQNLEGEETAGFAPGVRRMTSSAEGVVVGFGGHKYAVNDTLAATTPLSPLGSFTPPAVTVPLRPVSIPSSALPKGPVHKRQTRSLSQRMPLANTNNTMQQEPNTRSKALRESMALYINPDQDSTPSLVLNSSPVSEQASPLTPIENASDDGEDILNRRFLPAKARGAKNSCPMPLCGSPLLTASDRKHNLCAECRDELQPRQSIFTSGVLNPFATPYSQTNARISSRVPLTPEDQCDSTDETAQVKLQAAPKKTRHAHGESKRRPENRRSGPRLDGSSVWTIEEPTLSPMIKINNSHVISRFNKDRGDFKLQSVPASRRHAHRTQEQKLGRRPRDWRTSKQIPGTSLREERSHDISNKSNHIGFQLAGWQQTATASQIPRPPTRRPGDVKPREMSGPLLEPKTFHPPTPPARKDRDNPTAHRRTSTTRPQANRASATSSGRRPSSLSKVPIGKPNVPTTDSAPTRNTGRKRSKHHSNPDGLRYRISEPVGDGTCMRETDGKANPKVEKMQAGEDIYHEIDSIIDCYLRLPDASKPHNEKRKAEAIASYFSAVPLDVEMKIKGFI
ncbi:hypothetical protein F5Y03DRAFT_347066 [Xylaria venustula]|nr:hypothetical protein F5Y03DRAFT_347066 [Xylaria venustula]